jgi:hypothetical protein
MIQRVRKQSVCCSLARMRFRTSLLCFCSLLGVLLVLPISASSQISPDPQIMAEVNQIKAVDNHTHVPKVVGPGEKDDDFDALPCDPLEPTEPSRDRARPNRAPCASGARVPPTTDAAHASNAPAHYAIHDARDLPVCCGVRVSQLLRGVHVLRERLGADIRRGLLPEGAALRRKVEPLRE